MSNQINPLLFRNILLAILACLFLHGHSTEKIWPREKLLWSQYNSALGNTHNEISALQVLMKYYYHGVSNRIKGDSVSDLCLNIAYKSKIQKHILDAYEACFKYGAHISQKAKYWQYIDSVKALSPFPSWHVNYFTAEAHFIEIDFKHGLAYAQDAIEIAKKENRSDQHIKSLLIAGQCAEKDEQIVLAMSFFFEAQNQLPTTGENGLRYEILRNIQRAYFYNYNYNEAKKYSDKQLALLNSSTKIDSVDWLNVHYEMLEIEIFNSNFYNWQDSTITLMEYCKANGYMQEYDNLWALIRSKLMELNDFSRLYELYVVEYPEELEILKLYRPLAYERIKAYLYEHEGQIDSADYQWKKVLDTLISTHDTYRTAHVKRRFAQYLKRTGRVNEAYEMALEALSESKKANYNHFMAQDLSFLAELKIEVEDYKSALDFTAQYNAIQIKKILNSRNTDLAVLGQKIEYEQLEKIRQLEDEKERARTLYNYIALIGSLVVFIIVSFIVYRQYRSTRREKDRSDNLLLNILPKQTANELKEKGFTTAKKFENVTVFFCDIVGFTKIAEQLSPEELVKEIDTYFKAFDTIMTHYGIEKIKTIGDAYMAAGGLQDNGNTAVFDVLNAALDILEKVEELRIERQALNKPAFQLRVGINTGAIVAGVVGSTKFQYDIWGDAVNTAARMEQNSEPGRINVSQRTYDLIKDSFKCSYRGLKEAKNKGQINMYFVEKL